MNILLVYLRREEDVRRAAPLLLELGIFYSSLLDGEGVENIGVPQEALFSSFRNLFGQGSAYNRILVAPVPRPELVDEFVQLCGQQGIDFKAADTGWLALLPSIRFIGPQDEGEIE